MDVGSCGPSRAVSISAEGLERSFPASVFSDEGSLASSPPALHSCQLSTQHKWARPPPKAPEEAGTHSCPVMCWPRGQGGFSWGEAEGLAGRGCSGR